MARLNYSFPFVYPIKGIRAMPITAQTGEYRQQTRAGGVLREFSVYFYWWAFLKESEPYMTLCENGGKGGNKALREVYKDFGDVRGGFWKWWNFKEDLPANRGAYLFGAPVLKKVEMVTTTQIEHTDNVLYLAVPLDLPITKTMGQIRQVVRSQHSGQRGVRNTNYYKEHVKYIPSHSKSAPLAKALKAHKLRIANPNRPIWWIGNEIAADNSPSKITQAELNSRDVVVREYVNARKNTLKVDATRTLKRAKAIIDGVEIGKFPNN